MNPETFKDFSAPILSGTLPCAVTLSLTIPVVTCTSVNTCQGEVKREELWLNLCLRGKTQINEQYMGERGLKKNWPKEFNITLRVLTVKIPRKREIKNYN